MLKSKEVENLLGGRRNQDAWNAILAFLERGFKERPDLCICELIAGTRLRSHSCLSRPSHYFLDHSSAWENTKTGKLIVVTQPYINENESLHQSYREVTEAAQAFADSNRLILSPSTEGSWHCPKGTLAGPFENWTIKLEFERIVPRPIGDSKVRELGHRKRFLVLRRDGFACGYCHWSGPSIKLHVDHVISKDDWVKRFGNLTSSQTIDGVRYDGAHDLKNLKTSCQFCNLGKGPLSIQRVRRGKLILNNYYGA